MAQPIAHRAHLPYRVVQLVRLRGKLLPVDARPPVGRVPFAVAAVLLTAGLAIALGWSDQARHAQDAAAREQP